MALPPLVPVDALERALGLSVGTLAGADLARAEEVLQDASALVRLSAGRTWVDAGGVLLDVPEAVFTITRTAARRGYDNPHGFETESIGSYSYTLPGSEGGGVYLTATERADVRGAVATRRGLRTMATTKGYDDSTVYVPVVGTTTEFPWYDSEDLL